ncbi:MAG: molybdopterin-dependent oxidoreductase [Desulfurococcales archaeon]|nr:molybdopterin-dependent oxidoreductase [Desulfurococcales archaeon]
MSTQAGLRESRGLRVTRREFIKMGLTLAALGAVAGGLRKARAEVLREVEEGKPWVRGETGGVRGYRELTRVPPPGDLVEVSGAPEVELSTPKGLRRVRPKWFKNWLDWREYEGRAWPKKVEKRYFIATGGVCGFCETSCHYIAWIDKDTNLVRKIMVNPFAKNNWALCVKGQGVAQAAANPDRLVYILSKVDPKTGRRVGERGDDNWIRITYDESLELAAEYWYKGIYEYIVLGKPEASKTVYWMEGRPLQQGWVTHGGWGKQWEQQHSFHSHTNLCSAGQRLANATWTDKDRNSPDYFKAKLMIFHGKGILGDTGHYLMSHGPRATIAKFRGAKVISVREKYFHTDLHADYWVSTWPGTEAILWLAVANVLVNELDAVNWEFVRRWVNWDWFVRDRDGIIRWLLERGYIKTPPPEDIYERLPDGRYAIRDYKRAFEWFKTFMREYLSNFTPEYAAWVTRVNATTPPPSMPSQDEIRKGAELIRAIAREIARAGTAISIHQWRGPGQTYGGWMTGRALFLAAVALTGAFGTEGGTGTSAWHNLNFVYHGWKGSLAYRLKGKKLKGPGIWNEYVLSPEEQAFGHYDPTNPNVFKWYDEEWKAYWRERGFPIPDKMYLHFSRVVNPLATYQGGVLWAKLLGDKDKVELVIHATPFINETVYFSDMVLPEGFFHERHEGQPASSGIYAPAKWISVRWPIYYTYLTRVKGWKPRDPHRTAYEANREVGLGDALSYQEWSLEVYWRVVAKAVLRARREGVPLEELLREKEIDYLGLKVKVPSLADRLEFLIDYNRGVEYARRIGVEPERLAEELIRRLYNGEISYEQWVNELRKELLIRITDWYNWAAYEATPRLASEAQRRGMEPVEYLEAYQFWEEVPEVYKQHTYELKLSPDKVAWVDPVTKLAYGKKGEIVGVEVDGVVYKGQKTWSRKLEFFSLPMREQELMEVSIPIFPREEVLRRAIEGDVEAVRRIIEDKHHLIIPIMDFWAKIPGLTTGIDPRRGELLFVANSRFLFASENSRSQYNWFNFELFPALYLWVNPIDAEILGLKTGDTVRVRVLIPPLNDLEVSSFVTKVWVTNRVREGVVIMLQGQYRWRPAWWRKGEYEADGRTYSIVPSSVTFTSYEMKIDGKNLMDAVRDGSLFREWRKFEAYPAEHTRPMTDAELDRRPVTRLYREKGMPYWDQAKFVWWKESGVPYDFVLPVIEDPVAWTNLWHFKVKIEKVDPAEYGKMEFDYQAAKAAFDFFFKLLTHGSRGRLARGIYSLWRQRWGLNLEFPRILGVVKGDLVARYRLEGGSLKVEDWHEKRFRRAFFLGAGIGGKPDKTAYLWPPRVPDLRELP